jgi:hypothetical protein
MADGMYEVIALIPEASDFSLDAAVAHFGALRKGRLLAELATAKGKRKPSGFRVSFGDWSVVAWLESGEEVLVDSQELATTRKGRPAKAEVIAACSRRLSVWSDEDAEADHTDDWIDYIDFLRQRFEVFVFDNVNGQWWA